MKSVQSIVKPVVRVKRSHLTTYFEIHDDSLTNLRVTQENWRMMKETNIYPTANRPESVSTSSCDKRREVKNHCNGKSCHGR